MKKKDEKKVVLEKKESKKDVSKKETSKKNKFWFGIMTGLLGAILIIAIVGLFI